MGKVFNSICLGGLIKEEYDPFTLLIPGGYNVIGTKAFQDRNIWCVHIPPSIIRIDTDAFHNCLLNEVVFVGDSMLEEIGVGAFSGTLLTKIKIPSKVTKIAREAFRDCSSLKQVKFSEDSMLEELGDFVFYNSSLTKIVLPASLKRMSNKTFAGSKLEKVTFGQDAIIYYDDNRNIKHLTIYTRNKELAILLIGITENCENLVIKYKNYQELNEFIQLSNKNKGNYKNITLIGEKLSTEEERDIKKKLKKVIRGWATDIVFLGSEKAKVSEEKQPTIVDSNSQSVLSKENEELLGKIKSTVILFPRDLQASLNNKISSLLEEYNQKLEQSKPNLANYLNPTSALQVELSIEGDLEHWLFSKLLEIQSSLIHYDSIILGLKRLEDCRELLKLEIVNKPKEVTNVVDIIMIIIYLTGKVDDTKKKEVLKDLETFLNETIANFNTKLQEMNKLYESKESNILLPGEEYALPMVDLKVKLLAYMEELSKYVIKVIPYLSLLETLKTKKVLEYKGETNSIYDNILGIKYVIPLIKNQVGREMVEKEFSSLCDEFIKRIENILTKINEAKDNDYLNLEKELSQRLQPLLEKLDIYVNQNDYMEQLINCRNMLKSNKKELNPKKAIESYIGETYDMILKLPLNEQELARQKLLGVIEKWINNMPEEKEVLDLLREIYGDITEISFSLKEYLGAIEDYSNKTRK